MLTKQFGEDWTKRFTTAHEALPGNPATREAMDLYNNQVGRTIAVENPSADENQLSNLVKQAIDDGKMIVIDQLSNLNWSNKVALWQHGLSDPTPGNDGDPVPNPYA